MKFRQTSLIGLSAVALAAFAGYMVFEWTINRIYVPEGKSLQLRYKGPLVFGRAKPARAGYWAEEGEIGIYERLRGPGRHFYCPIWWERQLVGDVQIEPGKVGIVTCKLGDPLPNGEFLVDGEIGKTKNQGVLRKVLGPGRYRINTYGYDVKVLETERTTEATTGKLAGWVNIPTGFVGVVTNLAANPQNGQLAGIQDKVLPPGLYPINPKEQQIDIVGVGYHETTIAIDPKKPSVQAGIRDDRDSEPEDDHYTGGISFPSSDGFNIVMDFTAVWGLMPDQAANAIRKFGNFDLVETKVVLPQIESICRNNGSEYPAVKLLVGDEREQFQNDTLAEFKKILNEKEISLLYGLVRHIYIPREVREPIQTAFVADELKLTREQEQLTAQEEASLREAERKVELESKRVMAETQKLVAQKIAEAQKTVGETEAETRKLTAAIAKETAELEAQAKLLLGKADGEGKKLVEEAKAGRFKLAVKAFGSAAAYNNWIFATGLPENMELKLLYAGQGTLWTDLKNSVQVMVPQGQIEHKPAK